MEAVLKPQIDKLVRDQTRKILNEQVIPWAFCNTSKGIQVKRFDGKTIYYSGVAFVGSPVEVFWGGYIEPFIEDLVIQSIEQINSEIVNNNLDAKEELTYLKKQLYPSIEKIYTEMQQIDHRLRSNPTNLLQEKVNSKNIHDEIGRMNTFLEQQINMALKKSKSKNPWVKKLISNQYVVGIIVGAILIILALIIEPLWKNYFPPSSQILEQQKEEKPSSSVQTPSPLGGEGWGEGGK